MESDEIKFIKRGMIFSLVFIFFTSVVLFLPAYVFLFGNEHLSLNKVLILQKNPEKDVLFGKAYSNEQALYKLKLTNSSSCQVITLGTSRVMQFRSNFFNKSFCNLGGGIASIKGAKEFLEKVDRDKLPRLLILGLDQNFFHEKWDDVGGSLEKSENYLFLFPQNALKIYSDIFNRKIDFLKLREKGRGVGINAIMNGDGFRNDGSYFYNQVIAKNEPVNLRVASVLSDMGFAKGRGRFVKDAEFDRESLKEISELLEFTKDNNIYVVGFLPPFAKEVWDEVKKNREDYKYMFTIYDEVSPVFEKYNYDFYDYTDLNTIKASSCEVIDGIHGSEKAYLRVLIDMAKKNSLIKEFVDIKDLDLRLKNSYGCFNTIDPV